MTQFFIGLYDYFERHKILFYLSLICCVLLMGFFALQVRFEENVTQFFPDTKDSQNAIKVFDNLKIKDKIIIMLSAADADSIVKPDSLIEAADQLQQTLTDKAGDKLIKEIFAQVDQSLIGGATDFVYDHLPLFFADQRRYSDNHAAELHPSAFSCRNRIKELYPQRSSRTRQRGFKAFAGFSDGSQLRDQ